MSTNQISKTVILNRIKYKDWIMNFVIEKESDAVAAQHFLYFMVACQLRSYLSYANSQLVSFSLQSVSLHLL